MGKNQIERLLEIDRRIRAGKYPSRREVAEYFEVNIKTIERDIEYMKYRLEAPIEYDRSHRGYYYSDDGFFVPTYYMTEGDALYLYMSHYLGVEWNQEPFSSLGNEAMKKLSRLFPESIALDPSTLSSNIEFIRKKTDPSSDSTIWLALLQGSVRHQKVEILYKIPGREDSLAFVIHPYKLINHNKVWYVSAMAESLQEMRTYKISRMTGADLLEASFHRDETLDPLEGMDRNFGIYHEEDFFTVTIIAEKRVAHMMAEELIECTQKLNEDGKTSLSFSTNQYHEVLHWLLKWGKNIEVLEPKKIRKELRDIGKHFISTYEGQ